MARSDTFMLLRGIASERAAAAAAVADEEDKELRDSKAGTDNSLGRLFSSYRHTWTCPFSSFTWVSQSTLEIFKKIFGNVQATSYRRQMLFTVTCKMYKLLHSQLHWIHHHHNTGIKWVDKTQQDTADRSAVASQRQFRYKMYNKMLRLLSSEALVIRVLLWFHGRRLYTIFLAHTDDLFNIVTRRSQASAQLAPINHNNINTTSFCITCICKTSKHLNLRRLTQIDWLSKA